MLLEFIINKEFQQVYIKVDVTNANGVYAFFYNDKQVINEILVSNTKTAKNFLCYFRCISQTKVVYTGAHIERYCYQDLRMRTQLLKLSMFSISGESKALWLLHGISLFMKSCASYLAMAYIRDKSV